jgi:hypothetical protein
MCCARHYTLYLDWRQRRCFARDFPVCSRLSGQCCMFRCFCGFSHHAVITLMCADYVPSYLTRTDVLALVFSPVAPRKSWRSTLKPGVTASFLFPYNSSLTITWPHDVAGNISSLHQITDGLTEISRILLLVRFQVLTAACKEIAVFWDVASSSAVEMVRRFRGA